MSSLTLFTLGTPYGTWSPLAKAWLAPAADERLLDPAVVRWHDQVAGAQLPTTADVERLAALDRLNISDAQLDALQALRPSGASTWGGADPRTCWTAHRLAERFAEARFLVWVESPADALAHWLAAGGEGDPQQVLRVWEAAAQRIARLVQQNLQRCLVVLADEARQHPAALEQQLGRWLGLSAGVVPVPATAPAPDALSRLLAERLAAQDAASARLFSALYASCVPLVAAEAAGTGAADAHGVDALHVIAAYRQLTRQAASGEALVPQLQAALAERDASRRHGETLVARLNAATEEQALLLLQLHQVQEEFEATVVGQREQLTLQSASRDSALSELNAVRAQLLAGAQESELLLQQLHQVQEELERYYLAWRELDAGAATAAAAVDTDAVRIEIERIEMGIERDTPPHRELRFVLHGVQAGGRVLPRVEARLVEHHGSPGLALMATNGMPTPLMAWQPHGSEAGEAYMLWVPSDEPARRLLQALGTGDWQFIGAVTAAIARALDSDNGASPPRWRVVAARLQQQLAGLPARLRYDDLVVAAAAGAPGALDASFERVSFGLRQPATLRLRWWPQAAGGAAVQLLAPQAPGDTPPLTGWPVDDRGAWCDRWSLPLGAASPTQRAQAWHAMDANDRGLLLGVLDALPAVAARAKALGLAEAGAADGLSAAASRPLRMAHRALHGTRLRRVVRALRGRVAA